MRLAVNAAACPRGPASRALALLAAAPALIWAQQPAEPLTLEDRAALHVRRVASPMAVLASGAGAGIGQWRGKPRPWGGGASGYGRRYASAHGNAAVQNLLYFGFGAAFREDPRYRRSAETGIGGRLRHALLGAVTERQPGGGRRFRYAYPASYLGAGMLSNTWHPDGYNGIGDGFARAGIGAGLGALRNVVQEFLPDLTGRVFRRGPPGGKQ